MATTPFHKPVRNMDKQNPARTPGWKLMLMAGAIVGGGALTIAAGDSYFETLKQHWIAGTRKVFSELPPLQW